MGRMQTASTSKQVMHIEPSALESYTECGKLTSFFHIALSAKKEVSLPHPYLSRGKRNQLGVDVLLSTALKLHLYNSRNSSLLLQVLHRNVRYLFSCSVPKTYSPSPFIFNTQQVWSYISIII
jgi:hypothetical protein